MTESLADSLESLRYCYAANAYEDIANHLISFSLSKLIEALMRYQIPYGETISSGDAGLRNSFRRWQHLQTDEHLLHYLQIARRSGLNVLSIDEIAWLVALNIIVRHELGVTLNDIKERSEPIDFIAVRQQIRQDPNSDIISDALSD